MQKAHIIKTASIPLFISVFENKEGEMYFSKKELPSIHVKSNCSKKKIKHEFLTQKGNHIVIIA